MVGKCSPIITPCFLFDLPVGKDKNTMSEIFLSDKIKLISKHKEQKFSILLEMIRQCFHKIQKKKKLMQAKTIPKIWVAVFIQLIRGIIY